MFDIAGDEDRLSAEPFCESMKRAGTDSVIHGAAPVFLDFSDALGGIEFNFAGFNPWNKGVVFFAEIFLKLNADVFCLDRLGKGYALPAFFHYNVEMADFFPCNIVDFIFLAAELKRFIGCAYINIDIFCKLFQNADGDADIFIDGDFSDCLGFPKEIKNGICRRF